MVAAEPCMLVSCRGTCDKLRLSRGSIPTRPASEPRRDQDRLDSLWFLQFSQERSCIAGDWLVACSASSGGLAGGERHPALRQPSAQSSGAARRSSSRISSAILPRPIMPAARPPPNSPLHPTHPLRNLCPIVGRARPYGCTGRTPPAAARLSIEGPRGTCDHRAARTRNSLHPPPSPAPRSPAPRQAPQAPSDLALEHGVRRSRTCRGDHQTRVRVARPRQATACGAAPAHDRLIPIGLATTPPRTHPPRTGRLPRASKPTPRPRPPPAAP